MNIDMHGFTNGTILRDGVGDTRFLMTAPQYRITPQDTAKLTWTGIQREKSRTYHFPNNESFTVRGVTGICVRPTNHRLMTADGKKFVVPGKFLAIEIEADGWSA